MISDNVGSFAGFQVQDWSPGEPLPDLAGVAPRLRSDWDGPIDQMVDAIRTLADAGGGAVEGLVIGAWGEAFDNTSAPIVATLAELAPRLPRLRAIFIGDMVSEECEISWIVQSDMTPLLRAYPALEAFGVRGGGNLALGPIEHRSLRTLVIEAGGLPRSVVQGVASSTLPAIEHLEIWLGTSEYGGDATVADLQPILAGWLAPRYLGLRDAEIADEIAVAVADAPVLDGLATLDLSLGVLRDVGAEALLGSDRVRRLQKLDLHHHYLSEAMVQRLRQLPITVDVSDPQAAEVDGDDVWYSVAVSE